MDPYKEFSENYDETVHCLKRSGSISMDRNSTFNIIEIIVPKLATSKTEHLLHRINNLIKSVNCDSFRYEHADRYTYDIVCKRSAELDKTNYIFNSIMNGKKVILMSIRSLMENTIGRYISIPNPFMQYDSFSITVINRYIKTNIDMMSDEEIITVFRHEFDFDLEYITGDKYYMIPYLFKYRNALTKQEVSREEAFTTYTNFCTNNYLNDPACKNKFGMLIKLFCRTIHLNNNGDRKKVYALTDSGNDMLNEPKLYFNKLEQDLKEDTYSTDLSFFEEYFKAARDSYLTSKFTKAEAYKDYLLYALSHNHKPVLKTTFYKFMLNNCVVKRNNHRYESFVLNGYQSDEIIKHYMKHGIPDWMNDEMRADMEKIISIMENKTKDNDNIVINNDNEVDETVKDYISVHEDLYKGFNFTTTDSYLHYIDYCSSNNIKYIGKKSFHYEMKRYVIIKQHKPKYEKTPKRYFIIMSNDEQL